MAKNPTTFKMASLFDPSISEISVEVQKKADLQTILSKTKVAEVEEEDESLEAIQTKLTKKLKSASVSREEKVAIVEERISSVLHKQKDKVIVIDNTKTLHDYITAAINSGRIDIDTETNNSLDPVTCKIMGTCLYYPGAKAAYVPHNHIDLKTDERLSWQITEEQMGVELQRIADSGIETVMHNGKFDFEVIFCTTGVRVPPTWDTMVGWRLLDENDEAGLKHIYTTKVDPSQEKYDLESLCGLVLYAWIDPRIFALYAATDSMMTDKVYLLEKPEFEKEENKKLYKLFKEVEMPVVTITAEMEMVGVTVDQELGARLKDKYTLQLAEIDVDINKAMRVLQPAISKWRLSKEANEQARQYEPKKSIKSREQIEAMYPLLDEKLGKRYKLGKPKAAQLPEDINLASPPQLAILFYDILKCDAPSDKEPRGTGKEPMGILEKFLRNKAETESVAAAMNGNTVTVESTGYLSDEAQELLDDAFDDASADKNIVIRDKVAEAGADLCKLILRRREIMKLITTYIDVIPKLAQHWPDGRIRFHLRQLGTDTGRFASGGKIKYLENDAPVTVSGINIQNIPSHNKEIRMLFKAREDFEDIDLEANNFTIEEFSELETINGWLYPKDLNKGDILITDEGNKAISLIEYMPETKSYRIEVGC